MQSYSLKLKNKYFSSGVEKRHFLDFFPKILILIFWFILPVITAAQVDINPAEPVPVPRPLFGVGPVVRVTATGLVLDLIEIALAIVGVLSVLFVIIGGFRYVTAHGNEEQTEAAKKTLTHAIIGVVIVVLAFVIVRVIVNALIYGGGPGGT